MGQKNLYLRHRRQVLWIEYGVDRTSHSDQEPMTWDSKSKKWPTPSQLNTRNPIPILALWIHTAMSVPLDLLSPSSNEILHATIPLFPQKKKEDSIIGLAIKTIKFCYKRDSFMYFKIIRCPICRFFKYFVNEELTNCSSINC